MSLLSRHIFILLSFLASMSAGASDHVEISLLTCAEGGEIYELEGHSGLRIQHPIYGDFTVNWGVFDFNSPGFVYRFVKGETDYLAVGAPTPIFLDSYRRQGRTVREQTLDIDSLQAERLIAMIAENLKPENRVYRYNYVLDNCATRPLAMIEACIGEKLTLGHSSLTLEEGSTFRNVMRHYHRNYPWYQFGIDIALGPGIDRPISEREAAFAPVVLAEMMEDARTSTGEQIVTHDGYLIGTADTPPVPAGPTLWFLTPLFIACVTLALSLWTSLRQIQGTPRAARWFDTIFYSISGLGGLLLTFLIFVSVHEATSPNWLYLWLNPLCFIGAVAPWLKSLNRLEICYQSVNFALLIGLTVILLAGMQSPNPAFWPLMAASAVRAITIIYLSLTK